jgi:imidazolonepropionase-like amidohydrolase
VLGDDYGAIGFPHGSYGNELRLYVEHAGMSPLDIVRWATKNGAELARRGDDLGMIEPGKLADMIVVDGDPSQDIGAIADPANVRTVLINGKVVAGAWPA